MDKLWERSKKKRRNGYNVNGRKRIFFWNFGKFIVLMFFACMSGFQSFTLIEFGCVPFFVSWSKSRPMKATKRKCWEIIFLMFLCLFLHYVEWQHNVIYWRLQIMFAYKAKFQFSFFSRTCPRNWFKHWVRLNITWTNDTWLQIYWSMFRTNG